MLLSNRNKLLTYKRTYLFLYFPSVLNIIVFALYTPIANTQYNLILLESGWINAQVGGFGELFFNTYYLLFSVLGLVAIWSWKGLSKDARKRNTAMIISITFIIGVSLGTLTDTFINQYLEFYTPQLGIVFAIIPISGVFYSIKRHGLMRNHEIRTINQKEILTIDNRFKFYTST